MTSYLISFAVYTMAMVGIIMIALFVFKSATFGGFCKKNSNLSIEDTLKLSARKSLHVINFSGEKFLIAADMERTSLISKIGEKSLISTEPTCTREDKSINLKSFDGIESLDEFASIIDFHKKSEQKGPMMKELAKKLKSIS